MTTQPVGMRRPASLPGGVTGYPGQPVTWTSSHTSMTPFAVHAALTTASCPARVRTWPVSVMMLPRVPLSHRSRREPMQIPRVPAGPGMPAR
jgi:hypothetical protein